MSLPDGPIVITGASSGVGAELARRLAAEGRTVLALARRRDELERVAASAPERIRPLVTDLERPAAAALADALADLPPPAALINNAAVFDWCAFAEQDFAVAERIVRVGPLGTMAVTRVVAPLLCERRAGRIVKVASVAGLRGIAGQAAYCAAK